MSQPILLAMSTARKSPKSMEAAASLARERGTGLVAVFALEEDVIEDVTDKLSSEGWIGERPSQTFYDSAIAQRRELSGWKLGMAERYAEEAGVEFTGEAIAGAFDDAVKSAVARFEPSAVVLTRRKRSELSRIFFGSPAAQLGVDLDIEVVLVDED